MLDPHQETFQTWNKMAQLYANKFMALTLYEDTYVAFCEAVAKERATILEIGCGPGNITQRLLHHCPSFQIMATDVAPNMVALAQKNNPSITTLVLDARALDQLEQQVDGIMVGFAIPYLSALEVSKLVADSQALLHQQGILYLSFVAGKASQSGYLSGSTGDRVYFYYHPLAFIKQVLEEQGFGILAVVEKSYPKSLEEVEVHTIVLAKKV